jgi:hypothetical protein
LNTAAEIDGDEWFPCPRCDGVGCYLVDQAEKKSAAVCERCHGERYLAASADQVEAARSIGSDNPFCSHEWSHTGLAYGGEDESYHGEGRCYCSRCGADGDA